MVDVSSPEVLNFNIQRYIITSKNKKEILLTPEETQEFVEQQDNKWIFVDNTLIREEDLNSVNWSEADSVRVMPGLVGGASKLTLRLQTKLGTKL